jgi:hypothetical protein
MGLVGCASDRTRSEATLELSDVSVTRTGNTLEVRGVGAMGATVAVATLQHGHFTMQDDGREVDGLQMQVDVEGEVVTHESEGFGKLELPLFRHPRQQHLNAFLSDGRVASALASWNVTFEPPKAQWTDAELAERPSEVAFLTDCRFAPTTQCAASACAGNPQQIYIGGEQCVEAEHQYVCCGGTQVGAERACGYGWYNHANPCGMEGPGGCAVCWSAAFSSYCNVGHGGYWNQQSCFDLTSYIWQGDWIDLQ